MITVDDSLNNLRFRAGKLAFATESLATLLEEEGIRLKRIDQVARIKTLHASITKHIKKVKHDEMEDTYSYTDRKNSLKIAWAVTNYLAKTTDVDGWRNTSQILARPPADGGPPFGTILIRIGLGGIPDDVHVVSVSRLARESHRKESEIIDEMKKANSRLLTEDKFFVFLDWVAEGIMAGRWSLPFITQPPRQIQTSH